MLRNSVWRAKSGLYSVVLIVHSGWRPFQLGQTQIFQRAESKHSVLFLFYSSVCTYQPEIKRCVCSELWNSSPRALFLCKFEEVSCLQTELKGYFYQFKDCTTLEVKCQDFFLFILDVFQKLSWSC